MNVNKLVNTLGKALAGRPTNNNKQSSKRRTKRRRNNSRRRRTTRSTRAMPAAYASHIRPRFSILSRSNRHCVVSGCDLIYKIPATLNSSGDALFSIITANPAYWKGTRIGRIAPAYQTYRPLYFKVSYIPQVAVTQSGTVFMGTLWDMAPPQDNLQQSLLTSNGGQLTQCYIPADSTVALGRNLQQNLFKTTGALDTDTNPFIFCVGVAGANVIPGYLYVTYQYELRNPIGDSWTFINSGITTVAALPIQDNTANGSVILLNQVATLGPGTILDRENGANEFYYHGSKLDLPEQTNVIYFNNFQTALNTAARNLSIEPVTERIYLTFFTQEGNSTFRSFSSLNKYSGETLAMGYYLIIRKELQFSRYESAYIYLAEAKSFDYGDTSTWYLKLTSNTKYVSFYTEEKITQVVLPLYVTASPVSEWPYQLLAANYVIENLPN